MRNFTIINAEQRSDEWFAARIGRVTGSNAHCILMGEKTAGRNDYILRLALERILGVSEESNFVSKDMQRGIELEVVARYNQELDTGEIIRQTGFLRHNDLMIGVSLDGDSNDFREIWEFKCPKSTTHLKYLRDVDSLVKEYSAQLMHGLFITGAKEAIICSFDDRFPESIQSSKKCVKRSDLPMGEYEAELMRFLSQVKEVETEIKMRANGLI